MYAADQQTSSEMLLNAQVLYVQSNLCMEYYLQISIIWNNNIVEVSTFCILFRLPVFKWNSMSLTLFVQTLLYVDKMPAWTTQNIEDQVAA